jgi:UDP-glucose 4-epimerase
MKKVLVTGGCGFIGHNLVKRLLTEGYYIDIIDNFNNGRDVAKFVSSEYVNYYELDIRNIEKFSWLNYDYVFHLAALSRVQPSFENPDETFDVNVHGTRLIIEKCREYNCKLIYAGSASKHHNPEDSPYAMSKYMGELWCKLYKSAYKSNIEIARFYNVYGPGELVDNKYGSVIGIWRSKIGNNETLIIHGDGEQRRDFTHVDDIVDGLIKIAKSNDVHEDAWELGTGLNYSINELFTFFNEKHEGKLIKTHSEDVPGNVRTSLRLNDDTSERLGWKPTDRLREYINSL